MALSLLHHSGQGERPDRVHGPGELCLLHDPGAASKYPHAQLLHRHQPISKLTLKFIDVLQLSAVHLWPTYEHAHDLSRLFNFSEIECHESVKILSTFDIE